MSKSLRISDALFDAASACGAQLSRSTAQQVEHWARLGKALEDAGLTVTSALRLLEGDLTGGPIVEEAPESVLWEHKRALQNRDLARLASGSAAQEDMYLFTAETARKAKMLNGPY